MTSSTPLVHAVDSHAHVMSRHVPLVADRHSEPAREVTVEEYLGVLDANGISHGILTAPSFYGTNNALLLDALARSGGRLRGTAIVDPLITETELAALADAGICGVRFNWAKRANIPDIRAPQFQQLFRTAKACNLHIEIFLESHKLPDVLPTVLRSGVRVVLDHFAYPDPAMQLECPGMRMVLDAMQSGSVWVKLSAPFRLGGVDPQVYVDALMAAGGPQRLLWGSDWPWVSHEDETTYLQCKDQITAWVPDAAARTMILRDTPAQLFAFHSTQSRVHA